MRIHPPIMNFSRSRLGQVLTLMLLLCLMPVSSRGDAPKPNVVLIFVDDMGYGDIGLHGAKGWTTPHLDRMAKEGVRFTDFYVAQAVCSASRAALLTGCYSNRVGIQGALGPSSPIGIHENEMTLGELFKQQDYATAIYGKWHLGHHPQFLPTRHGFDEYYGLPYSNDMWPFHPTAPPGRYPPLPLIEGEKVIATNPDQSMLTTSYTERAVKFIEKHRSEPFFVYVPHSMPHVPLFVSDKFKGKSQQGLYGDVIMEIDWSVGEILKTLKRLDLDDKTLVIFTSDNGPWLSYGEHAGSAGILREGKGTSFDGGHREVCLMRWPGQIKPDSVQRQPAMTIDILPTLATLIDAKLPEHPIDGKNIWPLICCEADATSPHEAYFFYWGNSLQAVRAGKWKLHFPHQYRTLDGRPGGNSGKPTEYSSGRINLALFDMESDPGETKNLAREHPSVVEQLEGFANKIRQDLGDSAMKITGKGVRPPGRISR